MAITMNCPLRIATLMLVLISSGAFGQKRACDLIPDYTRHEAELTRKYTENIQVRMEEKGYDQMGRSGTLEGTATRTAVFGKGKMRLNSVVRHIGETDDGLSGSLYIDDEYYSAYHDKQNYVVGDHLIDSQNIQGVEAGLRHAGGYLPLTINGWMRPRAVDRLNDYMHLRGKGAINDVKSFRETTYQGKNAFVLTWTQQMGSTAKSYHDPSNSYALLGYELDSTYAGQFKIIGEITYEPSDLGYPVPKKYVMNYKSPEGVVTPGLEINLLEWKRYTPAADDFDLEKQFGLKPLPRPVAESIETTAPGQVSPPDAGEDKWIWVAGFALVPLCVVLVVFLWGRAGRRVSP